MTKASDNVFPRFLISEGGSTATPAAAQVTVYAKADGLLYSKDDAGVETLVSGGSGSGIPATIVDAKGDLIAATAADTVARLAAGGNGAILQALSTESTGLKWNAAPTGARVLLSSANYTGTTGSFGDVTGATVTITTLARRVRVGVVGTCQLGTGGDAVCFDIDIDGVRQGGTNGLTGIRGETASYRKDFSFTYLTDVLTAASHTFKLQSIRNVGSGTVTIFAVSSDCVLEFWAEETLLTA